MKRALVLVLLLFVAMSGYAQRAANTAGVSRSQQANQGLTAGDLSRIVQQCVDLRELQAFYPAGQVSILNYPYDFPAETKVTKGSQNVNFISQKAFSPTIMSNYFMFRSIQQTGNTVSVVANYFYERNGAKANKSIAIDYTNTSGVWTISKSTIN